MAATNGGANHLPAEETFTSVQDTHISVVSILNKPSIHLGFHLIPHIVHTVITNLPSSTYALVTDTTLEGLYLPSFASQFKEAIAEHSSKSRFITYSIPPGESTKSRQGKAEIEDWLLRERCTRDTVVIALGGGVVGDLVGFVAATFMRGVKVCQIPTTLLAMVDSSVGGKTAIDTPLGKNLIGAFHQPSYIFIDAAFLKTLPEREFVNGMAEVIKTAAIWDETEFSALESGVSSIRSAVLGPFTDSIESTSTPFPGRTLPTRTESQTLLLRVIRGSIAVKSHIVTIDPHESGLRNLVNFGHTIGHAIEAVMTPDILHGECVSIGMVLEAEISRSLGILGNSSVGRLERCLKSHGLPTNVMDPRIQKSGKSRGLGVERLLDIMRVDKKNSGDTKKIVLLSRIGKTYEDRASAIEDQVIARILSPSVRIYPSSPDRKAVVEMTTPGSKSVSNRALVLAALGDGVCRVRNLLHSDDTQVMMAALQDMGGAEFGWEDGGETLVVRGRGGKLHPPVGGKHLYLGNAGTASRFLTTVCTLVQPDSAQDRTVITGNNRMKERPISPLVSALLSNGCDAKYLERDGSLPLSISASGLKGGRLTLSASISSQYVSSILLSAPYAREPITLELVGDTVISQLYIDMTISMMKDFGIVVERLTDPSDGRPSNVYRIPKGVYKNPEVYNIESDASSATYPLAIAAITGTTCTIRNIGSGSLQGDARFAKEVLEPMGCKVIQTQTETTVTGPPVGQLRALGVVDMEPMTDAFLTAAVLAAVTSLPADSGRRRGAGQAENSTRIVGIANQRVKECNRIAAMMEELAKFGVRTVELEDGIEVFGIEPGRLLGGGVGGGSDSPPSVHCYDDHRVAMAFSVLGSATGGKGCLVEEKRCVEKTWPSWWDDLSNRVGIEVRGVELARPESSSSASPSSSSNVNGTASPSKSHRSEATIYLIGMRGAGKSYAGIRAAKALGWEFLDADVVFEAKHEMTCAAFVAANGWPAFRTEETLLLLSFASQYPQRHIISLGGGVVESPQVREFLSAYCRSGGPVVQIARDFDEICEYLGLDATTADPKRPAYGESIREVFKRREPWFKECSSHEFVTHVQGTVEQAVGAKQNGNGDGVVELYSPLRGDVDSDNAIARFFRFISNSDLNRVDLDRGRTFFLSHTFPDINQAIPDIEELTAGVDAVEFRVDMLSVEGKGSGSGFVPPLPYVAVQLGALRQKTDLPIVFTVKSKSQGGSFPDEAEDQMFELLRAAVRWGVEYVDLEMVWSEDKIRDFVSARGDTLVIASWHDPTGVHKWDSQEVKARYELASKYGDIVSMVLTATCLEDNFRMVAFRERVKGGKPLITLNMGSDGQLSRMLNPVFSPVTHPSMPARGGPGQLMFKEVQIGLHLLGQLPKKQFYLFGHPIGHSKSPLLHNTGFRTLGLPHTYTLHECETLPAKLLDFIQAPDFGGASVTIPHKRNIMPFLDELSDHARIIGAVNTIVTSERDGKRHFFGDNTDWLAIREAVQQSIPGSQIGAEGSTALVIGAGGTSRAAVYALHVTGFKTIYIFNRTRQNADKIVSTFPAEYNLIAIDSMESFPHGSPSAIVGTVPAEGTTLDPEQSPESAVYLPASIFKHARGVAVDMAYKPKRTPLLKLAESHGGWHAVSGIEILLKQGYHQFRLWTGRRAPVKTIRDAVLEAYDREQAQ